MNTNKPIRKVGIVLRPSSPELKGVFLQTREMLEDSGIEVMLESISGGMIELLGLDFAKIASQCDGLLHISKIPQDMQPLREHFSEGMGLECIVLGSPKGKIELGFR